MRYPYGMSGAKLATIMSLALGGLAALFAGALWEQPMVVAIGAVAMATSVAMSQLEATAKTKGDGKKGAEMGAGAKPTTSNEGAATIGVRKSAMAMALATVAEARARVWAEMANAEAAQYLHKAHDSQDAVDEKEHAKQMDALRKVLQLLDDATSVAYGHLTAEDLNALLRCKVEQGKAKRGVGQ